MFLYPFDTPVSSPVSNTRHIDVESSAMYPRVSLGVSLGVSLIHPERTGCLLDFGLNLYETINKIIHLKIAKGPTYTSSPCNAPALRHICSEAAVPPPPNPKQGFSGPCSLFVRSYITKPQPFPQTFVRHMPRTFPDTLPQNLLLTKDPQDLHRSNNPLLKKPPPRPPPNIPHHSNPYPQDLSRPVNPFQNRCITQNHQDS